MTPVTDPAILAQLNGGSGKPVTDPAVLAQLNAKPAAPTMMQNIIASPVGRFVHDAVLPMLSAPGDILSHIDPTAPDISRLKASNEAGYQGALAAQRNSPGYAAARQQADAIQSKTGGGLTDQFIAPVLPATAGLTGGLFGGSWDAMNANADAATDSLKAYQTANPVKASLAQAAGGFLAAPGRVAPATIAPAAASATASAAVPVASQRAAQYVSDLAAAAGKDPAALAQAGTDAAGKPIMAAEAIGKPGTVGLAALGRRSGTTPDALQGLLDERSAGAPGRVLNDYATASGINPVAAQGNIDALVQAGRAKAEPLYKDAFAGGSTAPFQDQLRTALTQATGAKGVIAKQIKAIEQNNPGALAARGAAGADVRTQYMDLHQQLQQAEADRQATLGMFQKAASDNSANAPGAVWSPRIQQFLNDPVMKQGLARGLEVQRLESLRDGKPFNPTEYAVTGTDADGSPVIGGVPNMRLLDAGKRGLDSIINDARDSTTGRLVMTERVKALIGVKNAYLDELDALNPRYKAARVQAGDYLSSSQAFSHGQNAILNPNMTAAQFSDSVARASPSELEAMKGGVANKLFSLAQNSKLDPKVFNRPIVQQKLTRLLGDSGATKLLSNIKTEATMAQTSGRMRPGAYSPTQELNAAMAEQDEGPGSINLAADLAGNTIKSGSFVRGALNTGMQHVVQPGLDYLKTPGMSVPVRDEAGRLLMMKPEELAAYLGQPGVLRRPPIASRLNLPPQTRIPFGLFGSTAVASQQQQR